MNYYNKKCLGCGNFFSKDEKSPSFVLNPKETTKYCKRCFQLKHYGKLDNSNVDDNQIKEILENIDTKNNYVICIVDLLDLGSLKRMKNKNVNLIAINKYSLLPKNFNFELTLSKIEAILDEAGFKEVPFIFYDAVNKYNISAIYKIIKEQSLSKKKVYIIGNTNVGKSSLINALLKYVKKQQSLSVSWYPNTTLNLSKIKLDKFTSIIDTPGLIDDKNFITNLNLKSLEKLSNFNSFSSKTFLLKDDNQCFFIESFFYLKINKIDESKSSSITFFIPKGIKIHRTKHENIQNIKDKRNELFNLFLKENNSFKGELAKLDKNSKYNLFVNGIALISLKNVKEIEFFYENDIKPFLTDKALI